MIITSEAIDHIIDNTEFETPDEVGDLLATVGKTPDDAVLQCKCLLTAHLIRKYFNIDGEDIYRRKCDIESSCGYDIDFSDHVADSDIVTFSSLVFSSSDIFGSTNVRESRRIRSSNNIVRSRDVFDSTNVIESSEVFSSTTVNNSDIVKHCSTVRNSNTIMQSTNITNCINLIYCHNISNSRFAVLCDNAQSCLFCLGVSKQYAVFNQNLTQEEYEACIADMDAFGFRYINQDDYFKETPLFQSFCQWAATLPGYKASIFNRILSMVWGKRTNEIS